MLRVRVIRLFTDVISVPTYEEEERDFRSLYTLSIPWPFPTARLASDPSMTLHSKDVTKGTEDVVR